jgi:hypothetical protein
MKKLITTSVLTVLGAVALAVPSLAATKAPRVVSVVIAPNLGITVSPKSAAHGTVVFKVGNHDSSPHEFSINGRTSVAIPPHTMVKFSVTFKKPGLYSYTLPDASNAVMMQPGAKPVGGEFKVS